MHDMVHDPTFFGWLTTGAYAAAAATCTCAAVYARTQPASPRGLSLAWIALAVGIALLGLNKQLDLQTAMTNRLRMRAEHNDWYQHRRTLQAAFVFAAIVVSAAVLWFLLRHIGLHSSAGRFTLAGTAVLVLYLLLRIADIERIDEWLGISLSASLLRGWLEWAGLALLAIGAWRAGVPDSPRG